MGKNSSKSSMQSIADSLGISKAAVSIALSGKSGVSDETRNRVYEAAQKLGYLTAPIHDLSSNKILVLIPEYIRNDSFFYNTIYWAIESYAKEKGYTAILSTVTSDMEAHEEMPAILEEINFLGIILVGVFTESYLINLSVLNKPIISTDQYYANLKLDCSVTANIEGSYSITKHVIDQGHTEIGFIGSISQTSSIFERWCGYIQAMMENNLTVNPSYSILVPSSLTSLLSNPKEIIDVIKNVEKLPTAYICGGDRIAISAIEALKELGYSVPDDISVTGFDNLEISSMISPQLTTVNVKREELGINAVKMLINRVKNNEKTQTKISVYTDLIIRNSVKKL